MKFGGVLLRFALFLTLLVAMVSCQQGPEPESPGITEPVSTLSSETTQQPPTATPTKMEEQTIMSTPKPTNTDFPPTSTPGGPPNCDPDYELFFPVSSRISKALFIHRRHCECYKWISSTAWHWSRNGLPTDT